jgi:hypothetical protein
MVDKKDSGRRHMSTTHSTISKNNSALHTATIYKEKKGSALSIVQKTSNLV